MIINCGVFFTLFWSHLLLGEQIGPIMITGCVLGLIGTIAVIRAERKQLHRNLILNPGLGKTIIAVRMIIELRGKVESGLISGDVRIDIDAK